MTLIRIASAVGAAVILTTSLSIASAPAATKRLYSSLSGAQEVPSKGDPNGTATATISYSVSRGACYVIRLKNVERKVTGAHIHKGRKGTAGAIVIPLLESSKTVPASGTLSGCAKDVTAKAFNTIFATPRTFYVNVHTAKYPSGAVRGQLSATKPAS